MIIWPFFLCGCWVAREHNPGPEIQTDEELIAWIKQYTNSIARMCYFPTFLVGSGSLTDFFLVALYRVRRYVGDLLNAPTRQGRGRRSAIEGQ
jgi:hypothetical protein